MIDGTSNSVNLTQIAANAILVATGIGGFTKVILRAMDHRFDERVKPIRDTLTAHVGEEFKATERQEKRAKRLTKLVVTHIQSDTEAFARIEAALAAKMSQRPPKV